MRDWAADAHGGRHKLLCRKRNDTILNMKFCQVGCKSFGFWRLGTENLRFGERLEEGKEVVCFVGDTQGLGRGKLACAKPAYAAPKIAGRVASSASAAKSLPEGRPRDHAPERRAVGAAIATLRGSHAESHLLRRSRRWRPWPCPLDSNSV